MTLEKINFNRKNKFKRREELEKQLQKLNNLLRITEEKVILNFEKPKYPVVMVLGAPRSGTTLITQWLASTGFFSYPTNIMSRFYDSPYIGAQIHKILVDLDINNEILGNNKDINYNSELGRAKGSCAPHEFWYFWRRFFPYDNICFYDNEFLKKVDQKTFVSEIAAMENVFNKPFMLKANIICYNILFINKILPKCIFIHIKRESFYNIQSILESRKKFYGTEKEWYSFKIKEYDQLKKLNPVHQVVGQVYYTNKIVEEQFRKLDDKNKIKINYEDFCENPKKLFEELKNKLFFNGYDLKFDYKKIKKLKCTNIVKCSKKREKEIFNGINKLNEY